MSQFNVRYGLLQQVVDQFPIPTSGLTGWFGDLVNNGVERNTLSNGAAITQWDDMSGNDNHLDVIVNSPTYNATEDAIDLDYNDSVNNTGTTYYSSQKGSKFYVIKYDSLNGNNGVGFVLEVSIGLNVSGQSFRTGKRNSSVHQITTAGGRTEFPGLSYSTANRYLINTRATTTNENGYVMRRNGSNITKGTTITTTNNFQEGLSVGSRVQADNTIFQGNGTMDGKMYEVIVYNRDLTGDEITQIENYLNDKYSIY